jgi:hypothetical protein
VATGYDLLAIYQQAADELRAERARPPTACPNDGEPLTPGRVPGTLHCLFDGWQYPRDWHPDHQFDN